ncbi:hypothetical protein AeMF1_018759 [Aphanomyces euteiches]|nr:hypothetical protein AeMF1_018759 [Aphanomyces euteiches]KAH9183089.1 hypothetical protein AeNC1_014934 [Aphanomyces euteiches]
MVNNSDLLSAEFMSLFESVPFSEQDRTSLVKRHLNNPDCPRPIQFDRLTAPDFVTWLITLRRKNGENLSYSALNTHRSGLFNLFRKYGVIMSIELEKELSSHFKGLKRTIAKGGSDGLEPINVGKDPLSIDTYQFLAKTLLGGVHIDMVFARTFMIIAWNLMCRAANAFGIKYGHMEWSNDALCIYFAYMKNDQSGDRPRDPRHGYIGSVLILAIHRTSFSPAQINTTGLEKSYHEL